MIEGQIRNALRGISGEFEINRLVGAAGGIVFILTGPGFQAWSMWQGHVFDVTAFCLAFPAGVATIAGGTAVAVAHKDKNVASAKVIQETGSKPATPPAQAPTVQPELSAAVDGDIPEYAR